MRVTRSGRRSVWAFVWRWTTTSLLAVVVLAALLSVGLPAVLGAQTFTVLTGSMQPGIPPGALVAVRATEIAPIGVGDVVTYQRDPGRPDMVTHRITGIAVDNTGDRVFTTRGDANNAEDPPVIPVQIVGEVVYVIPWLGYPHHFVSGPGRAGIVAIVGVAVIGYGVAVVVDIVRRRREAHDQPRASTASIAPPI